jgi:hypothetical protein
VTHGCRCYSCSHVGSCHVAPSCRFLSYLVISLCIRRPLPVEPSPSSHAHKAFPGGSSSLSYSRAGRDLVGPRGIGWGAVAGNT